MYTTKGAGAVAALRLLVGIARIGASTAGI